MRCLLSWLGLGLELGSGLAPPRSACTPPKGLGLGLRRTQPPTHHRLLLLPLQVRALALTLTLTLTLTRYEAYGVGGVGLIVNCLSDNNNRATMEVRTHYPRQSVSQSVSHYHT